MSIGRITKMNSSELKEMQKINVKIKKYSHFKGELPVYASPLASGFDIRARVDKPVVVKHLERVLIPTGLSFEIPPGFELQVRPRSGLSLKKGLSMPNTPGTIDADYRGELKIPVINLSHESLTIEDQQRIAQVVLCPVFQAAWSLCEKLESTQRGASGFGSTGV